MKGLYKKGLIAGAALLGLLGAGGYWYVFIAGVPQLDPPQAEANTGLNFEVKSFTSQAMGGERRYGIILPPDYAKKPQQRYPVIVLLHGGHGDEADYQKKAKLTSIVHDLYRDRRLPYSIIVTPDGSDNRGSNPFYDPDYFDGPNGKVATLIGTELVQTIKTRYRTLNTPQFWAMGGISSGGWGAFNIGLRHLNQFHILFSHTGYFTDKSGTDNSPLDFVQQVPAAQRQQLRAYLDAGENDAKYLDATQAFHEKLSQLEVKSEFRIYPGGHGIVGQDVGWNYWHKHLADSLSYVGDQFERAQKRHHPHHSTPGSAKKP